MFQLFMEPKKIGLPYNVNEKTQEDFFLFESTIRFPWKQLFKNN